MLVTDKTGRVVFLLMEMRQPRVELSGGGQEFSFAYVDCEVCSRHQSGDAE